LANPIDPKEPFRIEIRIDRASLRRALILGGSLILFVGVGTAIAVPVTFSDGNVLTSAQLNSNFGNLEQRMTSVEQRLTDKGKYSIGATYCGATAANYTGNIGGYVAGKTLCQATCANSGTAHMCVTEEILRSVATGVTVPYGWYSSGALNGNAGSTQRDCQQWSTADSGELGPAYLVYGLFTSYCNTSQPVLCCD
jgi:hypothetical protein